jgi:hypothetical protein
MHGFRVVRLSFFETVNCKMVNLSLLQSLVGHSVSFEVRTSSTYKKSTAIPVTSYGVPQTYRMTHIQRKNLTGESKLAILPPYKFTT